MPTFVGRFDFHFRLLDVKKSVTSQQVMGLLGRDLVGPTTQVFHNSDYPFGFVVFQLRIS